MNTPFDKAYDFLIELQLDFVSLADYADESTIMKDVREGMESYREPVRVAVAFLLALTMFMAILLLLTW